MYIGAAGSDLPLTAFENQSSPRPEDVAANRRVVASVQALNEAGAAGEGREFSYTRDPQTKRPVIRIMDSNTGDVIDQIPSEYAVKLAQELSNFVDPKAHSTITDSY